MKKIISIGELLIDFISRQKGCSLKDVTVFERAAGGAPANVACAVGRLGGRSAMLSQVGMDAFGTHIIEALKTAGVDTTGVYRTQKANTGLAFVTLDEKGERDFSFYRNPSADLFLTAEQITPDLMQDCGILHFCSVDLVDYPVKQAHYRAIALAKEQGAMISFDPNVRLPLWNSAENCRLAIREFLPLADIIKISDDELEFITGFCDPEQAKQSLFSVGCKLFLYTMGGNGSIAYAAGGAKAQADCVPVQVKDSTGAGDSFIGSFLYQLIRDQIHLHILAQMNASDLQRYLDFSSLYAAYTTTQKGAAGAMATLEEITAFQKGLHSVL